jgi:type I restriction enzyme, S subunit
MLGEDLNEAETWPVPKSWRIKALGEVAISIDYGTSVKCTGSEIGLPVLRIPNVAGGYINLSDLKFGQPKRSELDQVRLQDGDLLFVRTNGVLRNAGRCALYRGELENCYFASYLIRVRVDSSKVLPAFLNEYARTERGRSYLSGCAIRTADGKFNINSGTLKRVLLPLPPLAEQGKIAGVLGLVQRAIEQQKQLIALTTELKKALLHQLFTRGIRDEPQKQTEIGPVPQSWEVVELGSLASKISKGSSPRWQGFEYVREGVLFIRSQNVGPGHMEFADRVFLSSKFNEHEKRSILKDGDILINLVGASIGRVALGTAEIEGANCNQAVGFVRIQQKRSFKEFIVNYLLSPMGQQQMFFQKKDIARANLSLLDLRTFKVPVPSPSEANEIATVFAKIENKLDLSQQKHAALTALFRTLLHQLMTAQLRVNDLEICTDDLAGNSVI